MRGSRHLSWLGLMMFLLFPGCTETTDPCEPVVAAGRIQGRVRAGGLSVEAQVLAISVDGEYPDRGEFPARPDETGFYSLDLPSGRYVFQLSIPPGRYDHTASGPGVGTTPPDTVLVGPGIPAPNIDFILSGLKLDLDLPVEMHGRYARVDLHPVPEIDDWDNRWAVSAGTAEIVTGKLALEIAGILPGDYRIAMTIGCESSYCGSFNGERFWLPATHDPAESPVYSFGPDSLVAIDAGTLENPARIAGRVSGAWLDMGITRSPSVYFVTPDSSMVLQQVGTQEDGRFASEFLVPTPMKLMVSQSGIENWIGGPTFTEATVFDLEPGGSVEGIELVQSGIHLVVGESGLPPDDLKVLIYDKADLSLVATVGDVTASDRHVGIPNLWPGEYLLYLDQDSWRRGGLEWRPQWFDRATTADAARPILLAAAGEVTRGDLFLERGGVISGRVMNGETPAFFYVLMVYLADEDSYWSSRMGGPEGYSLTGLPDGDYVVGAEVLTVTPGIEGTIWYPGTLERAEATVIQIRDAAVFEGVDIVVPPSP